MSQKPKRPPRVRPCEACKGTGLQRCDRCKGRGRYGWAPMPDITWHTCEVCGGTGSLGPCPVCGGRGDNSLEYDKFFEQLSASDWEELESIDPT